MIWLIKTTYKAIRIGIRQGYEAFVLGVQVHKHNKEMERRKVFKGQGDKA